MTSSSAVLNWARSFADAAQLAGLVHVLDELMGLAVEYLVAAVDGECSNRLGDVTLAGAGPTDEKCVFSGLDELQCRQLQHRASRDGGVVGEVEVLQVLALGQPRERVAAIEQPRAAPVELVLHEPGEALDEIHYVVRHGERPGL
jgi:hypothetical protein